MQGSLGRGHSTLSISTCLLVCALNLPVAMDQVSALALRGGNRKRALLRPGSDICARIHFGDEVAALVLAAHVKVVPKNRSRESVCRSPLDMRESKEASEFWE